MKILFVGLGSAGQRHMRNLKQILGTDVQFMAYRVRKLQRVFDNQFHIMEGKELDKEYQIDVYDDFDKALDAAPDIVFITNQNSHHMEFALKAASAGCDLFIEKPISDTLEGISELQEVVERKKVIVYVGYQNRLHPCIKKAKELLEQGTLGNIFMVHSEIGEYLPKMHAWEDYRTMHEANKKLGGGVVICQLHEEDYLYHLFGMPDEVYCVGGKRSSLEIDVEDSATTLCRYHSKNGEFAIILHQDFLQTPPVRNCKIAGENGRLEFDLIRNSYKLVLKDDKTEEVSYENFQRNDMFIEEIQQFLEAVKTRGNNVVTIQEGVQSIKFALAIKKSMNDKGLVRL